MQDLQTIKQRFGIIGNHAGLNRCIEKSIRVAPTDISVLVIGESGVGKEFLPKIIHSLSKRKHNPYIAVNCGAIPEGTIDSELFGHEKGAFTGATNTRSGYFEVADGGTIFLDEVAELPLSTQVRLLRVLETGEFIKVGSSKPQKTNVRVVAATNVNVVKAVQDGKFREDLYYRLNTVQIDIPPLRSRQEDIVLLFRKFAADFAEKYQMPGVELTEDAKQFLMNYAWPGNIRQLRNLVEQISVMESNRTIGAQEIKNYLPSISTLPVLYANQQDTQNNKQQETASDREIIYKFLFDMKKDLNDLRKLTLELIKKSENGQGKPLDTELVKKVLHNFDVSDANTPNNPYQDNQTKLAQPYDFVDYDDVEVSDEQDESLSIQDKEKELILKALEKYKGKRKYAAEELGISERTLYRKIKQFNLQ